MSQVIWIPPVRINGGESTICRRIAQRDNYVGWLLWQDLYAGQCSPGCGHQWIGREEVLCRWKGAGVSGTRS
ncbi:hypothetical protein [Ktedonobacter sp. SOSP1-85]|uniref:hypothetical protein n=1 Tax=Ktedonobacter sp. SOSP1-85 TaxID=2778367 RepID=UPI001915116D|nr:hypothetical protein [Ktedonobacter sp. SOSP1-85]